MAIIKPFECVRPEVSVVDRVAALPYDVYNRPGTSGDENWSLRLPDNYKELDAINLADILKSAILARGKEFAEKNKKIIEKLDEVM